MPWQPGVQTSEDCLYLNIWTPSLSGKRSVIAWIHGGLFRHGSAAMPLVDGGNLASLGDVVVVTIAYRLGSFGFLYGGTEGAPGNQGLHDQLMALKWIQDNISSFGGDPAEVTLSGFSAGGISIGFFLTAPGTSALFKRAIVQSGPVTPKRVSIHKDAALVQSGKFARIFGCHNESSVVKKAGSIVSCMRNIDANLIGPLEQNFIDNGGTFTPVSGDGLLPTHSQLARFTGDRQVMIGYVANEGSVSLYAQFADVFSRTLPPRNVSKAEVLYHLGALHKELSLSQLLTLRKLYMGRLTNFAYKKLTQALVQEQTEVLASCPSIETALKLAEAMESTKAGHAVYFYELDYISECSKALPCLGMTHGDDIAFVFGRPFDKNGCARDIPFAKKLIEMWSNFAKGRVPVVPGGGKWPEFRKHSPMLLKITGAKAVPSKFRYFGRCHKLKKLDLY
ncbi:acetylcholinesterase-1 isoform X2 [Rhipicephalus sanguineus]|uniref:acetylcholinesterase-1 isoform X2 n=1 Tax=Rhipicephalus sanguineus TaxID=34632 RepID=UPI0018960207|nr:acetylcholinesterase-1 isoform X2 [Rhipicephalus sanguineus]